MFSPPCLYGYKKKIDWSETYIHLFHHHNYKHPVIYQDHSNDGRDKGWFETYIHFYHHHQNFLQHLTRNSGLSIHIYLQVLYHNP